MAKTKKVNIVGTPIWVDVDTTEPLFGNHLREAWRTLFGKRTTEVSFRRDEVKRYLRRCIRAWENKESAAENLEDSLIAKTYLEALKSVQTALFGKENS